VSIAALDLDLEVFSGPFDLMMALVLREEIDLLEIDLAGVVLAYLAHIESRGDLDLESATEFILLIAALLELKSRLILPGEDAQELLDIGPEEAAAELLDRMLQARRYQGAGARFRELLAAEDGVRFRRVPVPKELRDLPAGRPAGTADPASSAAADDLLQELRGADLAEAPVRPAGKPERLGKALGDLLRAPPSINLRHMRSPQVTVAERLLRLRKLLASGRFSFDEAVRGADRVTVAVTLYALLELYRRGEADWEQGESFGEITVRAAAGAHSEENASPPVALAG
jgi:segregation and condensation protein A